MKYVTKEEFEELLENEVEDYCCMDNDEYVEFINETLNKKGYDNFTLLYATDEHEMEELKEKLYKKSRKHVKDILLKEYEIE